MKLTSESGELQQNDDRMGPARRIRVNSTRAVVFCSSYWIDHFICSCQLEPPFDIAILVPFQHTKVLNGERSKDKRRR